MKKVFLLTVCLVFVFALGSAFASVTPPATCVCDPELVSYQGAVKWFCCLFPDGNARVVIKNSKGIVKSTVTTNAAGQFSGSFKAARAHNCGKGCCILWDSYSASTKSCVCVIGNRGAARPIGVTVTDCRQKGVSLNFFTICENMVSCNDC